MSSLSGRKRTDGQRLPLSMAVTMPLTTLLVDAAFRHPNALTRRLVDGFGGVVGDPDGVTCRTVAPGRLYTPAGGSDRLLVYLHGGGFVVGGVVSHGPTAALLAAEAGCAVLLVDYRLAPEHRHPAALEDSLAAYRWARAQGYATVAVGGDSAGGQLSAAICLTERPDAALLLYPILDGDVNAYASAWRFERGPLLSRRALVAALAHYGAGDALAITGDLSRFPPTHVATAGMDPLRDQGDGFVDRLRAAGVSVTHQRHDNLPHAFANLLLDPHGRAATVEVAAALRTLLSEPPRVA